jgi:3-oxoacyl-[acyl-carrier-protein] synthase-3
MTTQARKIHQVAIANMPFITEKALKEADLKYGDIDHIVPHQTSMRAIHSGDKRLGHYFGVRAKNIIVNLQEYGNTASTSHFLALYRYLNEKRFKVGDKMMLMALASGLTVGFATFTMDDLVDRYGNEN